MAFGVLLAIVVVSVSCKDSGKEKKNGEIETFTVNGVQFDMVFVKGGTFTMGYVESRDNDTNAMLDRETPAHQVTLSDYSIGKFLVTQKLWQAVMGDNPSRFKGDNLPVEMISWEDAQAFIVKLNIAVGKKFRLPTEAEWEYAARGGSKSSNFKYSGSNNIDEVAWYDENSKYTIHSVGTKKPNELGIYDMTGNVFEWCSDWYDAYTASPQTNPQGSIEGSDRVLRGGSWHIYAQVCRVAYRNYFTPSLCPYSSGLRLSISP